MAEIRIAETHEEVQRCYPIFQQLRPHLSQEDFFAAYLRMAGEGYRIAYLAQPAALLAVAGYRYMELLATGKVLYVDDLVTDQMHRSMGYGSILIEWLRDEATRAGCQYVELDSGAQRTDAHRFYERKGFGRVALHFSCSLVSNEPWTENSLT